jgi:glycine oxidase
LAPIQSVVVAGAGILGLWQALVLSRAGFQVRLIDAAAEPLSGSASRWAGAMLAPDCEAEISEPVVRELGHLGLTLWRDVYPGVVNRGTLVVAPARDLSELSRFERATSGHRRIGATELERLEPELGGRFQSALYFADEAHVVTPDALAFLSRAVQQGGVTVQQSTSLSDIKHPDIMNSDAVVIDTRGLGARLVQPLLRGVRGERLILRARDVGLTRPVRLLHPRHPLYVVPWGEHRFMVGATVIESEDPGPMTARSALELLGLAYALHSGFAEAEIVDMGAGVRPAFPSNTPHINVSSNGRSVSVNGAFRHGFLLAPVLATMVRDYLLSGQFDERILTIS